MSISYSVSCVCYLVWIMVLGSKATHFYFFFENKTTKKMPEEIENDKNEVDDAMVYTFSSNSNGAAVTKKNHTWACMNWGGNRTTPNKFGFYYSGERQKVVFFFFSSLSHGFFDIFHASKFANEVNWNTDSGPTFGPRGLSMLQFANMQINVYCTVK